MLWAFYQLWSTLKHIWSNCRRPQLVKEFLRELTGRYMADPPLTRTTFVKNFMWSYALVRSVWSHIANCISVDEWAGSTLVAWKWVLWHCGDSAFENVNSPMFLLEKFANHWKGWRCMFFTYVLNCWNKTIGFSNFRVTLMVLGQLWDPTGSKRSKS